MRLLLSILVVSCLSASCESGLSFSGVVTVPAGVVDAFPAEVFVQWTDPAGGTEHFGFLGTLTDASDDDIAFPVEHNAFGCPEGALQRVTAWAGPPIDKTQIIGCDEPRIPTHPDCVSPSEDAVASAEGAFPVESTVFEEWTKCGETGLVTFALTLAAAEEVSASK